MKAGILCLAVLALATGCAGAVEPPPAAWNLAVSGDEAALIYGTADQQVARFACARGAGRIQIAWRLERSLGVRKENNSWVDAAGIGPPWQGRMQLLTGDVGADMRAEAMPTETGAGTDVKSSLSTRAPMLPLFRQTGRISLTAWGETLAANPARAEDVDSFLAFCG